MPIHDISEHFNAIPSLNDATPDYALPSQYGGSLCVPVRCHYATQLSGTLPLRRGTLSDYATPMRCFNSPYHYGTMITVTIPRYTVICHAMPLLYLPNDT